MPEKVVTDKVLCYVVRDGRLLVFRHTDHSWEEVGIQVPVVFDRRPGAPPLVERTELTTIDTPAGRTVTLLRA